MHNKSKKQKSLLGVDNEQPTVLSKLIGNQLLINSNKFVKSPWTHIKTLIKTNNHGRPVLNLTEVQVRLTTHLKFTKNS